MSGLLLTALALLCADPAPKENPVPHTNHLARETSPYLLQHAHNPVDWYPWGPEALNRAKAEDKPIFLSIGYSACHWCHVMERESFENESTAKIMNQHFVCVKVDREERPDLDEIYMAATVGLTGSGGWPMSVWLTPDLKPFYAGTYYPPVDMYGRPGFPRVLMGLAQSWGEKRADILKSADSITEYLHQQTAASHPPQAATDALIKDACGILRKSFDAHDGGWGGAPKFPSSASILLLLREHRRTGDKELLRMATVTLNKMALGGMYDQIGGGFARYSVDSEWLVPHFEKMLYDNGQLAQAYLEAYQATNDELYRRITVETLDYLLRDMRDAGGAFHSAEDADSEGQEGKFYLWTPQEIAEVIGADDARLANTYYNVVPEGNFDSHEDYHHKQNILHVTKTLSEVAAALKIDAQKAHEILNGAKKKLLEHRAKRVRPGRDDKVLVSWNALAIGAFAKAGRVLGEQRYIDAAETAARFIVDKMTQDGALLRTHRKGESRLPAYLDDYAFFTDACIDCYEATFDAKWLDTAAHFADGMVTRFWDDAAGNFFFTGGDHANLIVRTKPTYDGAEPSGNSIAALALLRLGALLDRADYRDKARRSIEAAQPLVARAPQGYLRMLLAIDWLLRPPVEIAIAGPRGAEATKALLHAAQRAYVPRAVWAGIDPAAPDAAALAKRIPLLEGKALLDGKPAAYVCRNFTCKQPACDPQAFRAQLVQIAEP